MKRLVGTLVLFISLGTAAGWGGNSSFPILATVSSPSSDGNGQARTHIPGLPATGHADYGQSPTPTPAPSGLTINPDDFVGVVDNPYLPLTPGTTLVYEGETDDGFERIEVSVSHDVKEIVGVPCTVVLDRVWIDGDLGEETLDWFAQDKDGNVWYFGEDTKDFEQGELVGTAGSWEAGVDGAEPGIAMEADPQVGDSYRQEFYAGEAEDMAEVIGVGESVSIGFGSFENVLQTREWTPLEPGISEHKFYAPGIGLIKSVKVEGGEGEVDLIAILQDPLARGQN